MFSLSKNTKHFSLIAVIVGLSFYLGMHFYSAQTATEDKTSIELKLFKSQIEKTLLSNFLIQTDNKQIIIKQEDLQDWIEPYTRSYSGKEDLRVSSDKVSEYLNSLSPLINTEPINAKFVINNGRAETFQPSNIGKRLKITESISAITLSIVQGKTSASLEFDYIEPEISLDKINNLGINALLGKGESNYGNSPSSRIHNIKVGLAKFNGIILKPGEEFSFNTYLGEVNERSGYQSELVIKSGKLVYEYGGGLCQVATTVFRSAFNSGLDITERKPHSFAVQYYNPQGLDATIYPGVVDLKFINNSGGHILIQTRLAGSKLIVEIYGSKNNKGVVLDGPYQYDQRSNGAMKAYFIRKIYNGEELLEEERFNSVYKPPPPREKNPLE